MRGDPSKVAKPGPCRLQRLGPYLLPPSRRHYTLGEPPWWSTDDGARGAGDVALLRPEFRKDDCWWSMTQ